MACRALVLDDARRRRRNYFIIVCSADLGRDGHPGNPGNNRRIRQRGEA